MSPTNGESKIEVEDLGVDEKLNLVLEALREQSGILQEILEVQSELTEKVGNLSLEGDGYEIKSYN